MVVERNRRRNTRDKAEEEAETHTGKQRRTNKTQAQQTKQKLSAAKHHTRKAAEGAKKKEIDHEKIEFGHMRSLASLPPQLLR